MSVPESTLTILRTAIDQAIRSALAPSGPPPVVYIFGQTISKPAPRSVFSMSVSLTLDQAFNAVVTPKDRAGNPAAIQNPVWASSDETIVSVAPSPDGLACYIDTVGVGTARVVLSGDADLGEGVRPIVGEIEFVVSAGGAVTLEITGTAVDKA